MKKNQFPKGWDEKRVQRVLAHYEAQTEQEQVAEDEKAFNVKERTMIEVPTEVMPLIREILAQSKPV